VPALVVAALSARMLAQSARRAGWDVTALDLFGDVDTRATASTWQPIGDATALRIDRARFLAALDSARNSGKCLGWVAGAGFEPQPDLLDEGARILPLLGNDRGKTDRVRDPQQFFATLADLEIAHPETRMDAPVDRRGWLIKDFAASGGLHVRRAETVHSQRFNARSFFQREMPGQPISVLFVAADGRARSIGINELLVRSHATRPYVYHGALGPVTELPLTLAQDLRRAVEGLVRAFDLCGLGSLDVLVHGQSFSVLEINPRPSATMGLYDANFATGLVKVHVDACAGVLPETAPDIAACRVRGEFIVFARESRLITHAHVQRLLALGCRDVPLPQSAVAAGAPVCSVVAEGASRGAVRAMLAEREAAVLSIVQNRSEAHHHAG
jgi:predicted ATP-grasp superfamily ATP-dependent carboligase